MFWKNKGGVRKVYNSKGKYWDYEIIKEPNWKPKKSNPVTKERLLNMSYDEIFKNVLSLSDINKLKNKYENDFLNYDKLSEFSSIKTKFQMYFSYKKYIFYDILEHIVYDIISKTKTNKNIYYYNGSYDNILDDFPFMNRHKDVGELKISDDIKKTISNDIGIFFYWTFKNSIVFIN